MHTHTHTHSHSHTHIYCNLLLIEKPLPFSNLLQGTFQKTKGGEKEAMRMEIIAYSGSKKAGVVWEFLTFVCVCCSVFAVEGFEGYFPWL